MKTANRAAKPLGPAATRRAKQARDPAIAPVAVTPRTARPKAAKMSEMKAGIQNFPSNRLGSNLAMSAKLLIAMRKCLVWHGRVARLPYAPKG